MTAIFATSIIFKVNWKIQEAEWLDIVNTDISKKTLDTTIITYKRWFGYFFNSILTPHGLFNAEILFICKCLSNRNYIFNIPFHFFYYTSICLESFVCTQLYDVNCSYLMICTQLNGYQLFLSNINNSIPVE